MIEIKNINGEVIYKYKGANLEGANLEGANLRWADLEGAGLRGANLYQLVGFGSVGRCVTWDNNNKKIIAGCFYGSLEEFQQAVKESHQGTEYETQYNAVIELISKLFEV